MKFLFTLFFAFFLTFSVLAVPAVQAQQSLNINAMGNLGNFGDLSSNAKPSEIVIFYIGRVIQFLLGIAGALALVFFIFGGFQVLTSAGNDAKAGNGKRTLAWAIIGLVVSFGSYIVLNFIVNTFTRSLGG